MQKSDQGNTSYGNLTYSKITALEDAFGRTFWNVILRVVTAPFKLSFESIL